VEVEGIVELFRRVQRQNELHRIILAFSVSHDNEAARIYGRYALIDGDDVSFYRHLVRKFDITDQDGKDKWTTYKFTRNIYDMFVLIPFKRICSVTSCLIQESSTYSQVLALYRTRNGTKKMRMRRELPAHMALKSWLIPLFHLRLPHRRSRSQGARFTANDSIVDIPFSSQTITPVFK
jgi:hypothetical protein